MREQLRTLDQHNPLVPLALGLLALDRRFATLLETEVADGTPELSDDDPALALFLGVVSLRRTLHRWLEHACPEAPGSGVEAASATPIELDSLWGLGR
jgi:hypothetical protein